MSDAEGAITDHDPVQQSQLFEEHVAGLSLGIVIFDHRREVVFCNQRYSELYHFTPEQVRPRTPISNLLRHQLNLGLKTQSTPDEYIREHVEGAVVAARTISEFADGTVIAHTVQPLPGGGGIATHQDITELRNLSLRLQMQDELGRQQESRLRMRNLQFNTAINNMSQGLCFFDAQQRLIVCNERYLEMYGLSPDCVGPGTTLAEIVDMRFAAGSFPAMSREEYLKWRSEVVISAEPTDSIVELGNGRIFVIHHRPMPDSGWVATHEDITDQRRSEVEIEHMAHHDALTDLANRVLLNERLEQALARGRHDETMALHHLDLDRFKAVNDTMGHPAGDRLLRMVADRLRGLVRGVDTIARMGGDEFAIVQVAIDDAADASALAQRIIAVLSEPYDIDGQQVTIGVSNGVAVGPGDGLSPDELLRNADLALYRAKDEGRGTFRFFEPGMDLKMQARRMMEHDLRKALPGGQFELYYQPIVELASNQITGFEALIRWNHPERGLIAPNAFIPLAEETGLIVPIGEWVIRQACATASRWPDDVTVAVNVSAIQFRSPGFLQVVVGALDTSGLRPSRLEVEITESVLLHSGEATLAILHRLRSLGVRIAMDDFGTGYSSLTYLQSFPFDKIKIDRSFVKDILENAGSLNIVRAVAGLAKGMGMTTTAEGVESPEQLDSVMSLGCTEMQGFHFSRALPASEIDRLFLSGRKIMQSADRIVAA
jgi:diguanylate cyclase (GGDEF)-like protein